MPITVTFEADTFDNLVGQITQFIGLDTKVAKAASEPAPATTKPAKAPAKAKPAPEPVPEDIPDDATGLEPEPAINGEAVALEALKSKQLDRLRDLFSAGKVKFVRELLSKYGGGAKVFPEVDAAMFPAIKKAIDAEMGA